MLIVGLLSNTSAQIFQVVWEKNYGGSLEDCCMHSTLSTDSCIYSVGYTTSNDGAFHGNHGNNDVCVVKLNLNGDTLWTKLLGGTLDDKGFCIESTEDNGCIIAAATYSTYGQISINYGEYDYWIVKLDANGNIQWEKTYGGSANDYAKSIKRTSDNGYIINGWTCSEDGFVHGIHSLLTPDMWIIKININGDTLWTKCLGGTRDDNGYNIAELSDGNYIATGDTDSDDGDVIGNYASGYLNSWLVELDTIGNIIWSKCSGDSLDRVPYSLLATHNDCYRCFVLLENKCLPDYSDALGICKYNANGDTIWTKNIKWNYMSSSYPQGNAPFCLIQTLDTNLIFQKIVSFYYDSTPNIYIEKFNLTTGDSIWAVYLGEPKCSPMSILEVSENTFIVSGSKLNNSNDFYFLKFKVLPMGIETEHLKKFDFTVYPNPSISGQFSIELPKSYEQLYITILDNNGKILLIDEIKQNQLIYHFTGKLPAGTYTLSLSNLNYLSSKKLIIQ